MIQILYYDFPEQVAALSDAEVGRLTLAMVRYSRGESIGDDWFSGNERFIWPMVKVTLDRQLVQESERAERNRENGAKGGRPKKTQVDTEETEENPENPSGFDETHCYNPKPLTINPEPITVNPEPITKNHEHREKRTRFTPPTLDEVIAYKNETKSNVDPNKFIDYYESKGWKVGNSPMKSWQAAYRNWSRKEFGGSSNTTLHPLAIQNYTQRQYSGDLRNIFEDDEEVT